MKYEQMVTIFFFLIVNNFVKRSFCVIIGSLEEEYFLKRGKI